MIFNAIPRPLLWAVGAFYFFALHSPAAPAEIPTDIQAFVSSWDKAWANHNPKALGMLHTKDAITVNRYGDYLKGRGEIESRLSLLLTNGGPLSQVAFPEQHILGVRFIQPKVAIVQTGWESPEIGTDGKVRLDAVDKMILTYVLVKRGSEWKASEVDTHDVVQSMQH